VVSTWLLFLKIFKCRNRGVTGQGRIRHTVPGLGFEGIIVQGSRQAQGTRFAKGARQGGRNCLIYLTRGSVKSLNYQKQY
jgi:hypothetical protein